MAKHDRSCGDGGSLSAAMFWLGVQEGANLFGELLGVMKGKA
jgi:hypothetical protein